MEFVTVESPQMAELRLIRLSFTVGQRKK